MKIMQILPTIRMGDAIGNHVVALKKYISDAGYDTEIYAESIDNRLPQKTAKNIKYISKINEDDIVIYHMSIGSKLSQWFAGLHCRKIMVYHNITPLQFADNENTEWRIKIANGLQEVKNLASSVEYCIAMSEYNKLDLISMGYNQEKIVVMPYLIPFDDYEESSDTETLHSYSDEWVNILFVGRRARNKKIEDVIRAYAYYKKHINAKSRLILIGSKSMENYSEELMSYIRILDLPDVVFPGHISLEKLIAFYKCADVFVCMSEHEGFCIPLIESMYFGIPVIAYDSTAIADTMNGTGVLIEEKDPVLIAHLLDRITRDEELKFNIIHEQKERIRQLNPIMIGETFINYLESIIGGRI